MACFRFRFAQNNMSKKNMRGSWSGSGIGKMMFHQFLIKSWWDPINNLDPYYKTKFFLYRCYSSNYLHLPLSEIFVQYLEIESALIMTCRQGPDIAFIILKKLLLKICQSHICICFIWFLEFIKNTFHNLIV